MSGGVFVMKSESQKKIEAYLANEPFKRYGIQEYNIINFEPHYVNEESKEWFEK